MRNVNTLALAGNLTADPELRAVGPNTLAVLRLAFSTSKKVGGEWADKPNYINVNVWGNQAESCAKNLHKGSSIAITGRLEHETWEKDGQKRSMHSVTADFVQFMGGNGHTKAETTQMAGVGVGDESPF